MRIMGCGALLALAVSAAGADELDNWGHWRGPLGNGVAPQATPPTAFSPAENVRWKAEIPGRGSSSPVVWDDRVFVTAAVPTAGGPAGELDFRIICLDRQSGAVVWTRSAIRAVPHEGTHQTNGYASASPCTDGTHVYAHFGSRGLHCYALDGTPVWQRQFGRMQTRNGFGEGSSPTLAGDLVLVPWDHEGPSKLMALTKATGELAWEVSRAGPTCWATPLVVRDASGRLQVVMNGQDLASGYDLETGKELWRCAGQTVRPCASAVAADGIAYVGSGFQGSFMGAFDLAGRGDLAASPQLLWTIKKDTPDVASPLLSGDRLYFYKEKTGLLTCVEAKSGRILYSATRVPGVSKTYASPVAAGGHVYLTDRSGAITVIEDAPTFKVVATNDIGEGVDATPAPVGRELFVRGERHLFCLSAP